MYSRYSEAARKGGNGLACPFWKSDPVRYQTHPSCRPGEGWPKVGKVSEHIWRCHSPLMQCEYCGKRWPSLDRKRKLGPARDEHAARCRAAAADETPRAAGYGDVEIMTPAQQDAFGAVKSIRDNERKFDAMYRALGKPRPDTYHVRPLVHVPTPAPAPAHGGDGIFTGFVSNTDVVAPPPPPATYSQISRQPTAGGSSSPSRQQVDSGYASQTHDKAPLVDMAEWEQYQFPIGGQQDLLEFPGQFDQFDPFNDAFPSDPFTANSGDDANDLGSFVGVQ